MESKKQIEIKFLDLFYKYRFYLLFLALMNSLLVPPISVFPILQLTFKLISFTILILSGVNFIEENRKKTRFIWLVFGIFIVCISFFSEYLPHFRVFSYLANILKFIFFSLTTVSLIRQIVAIEKVTVDVILGSFCGYLLLGSMCFFLFMLIDIANPHALYGLSNNPFFRENQIFYYTFSCLTTAGFGDIVAITIVGQKLAIFTASIGQFYIAVIVATLISRYMNTHNLKNKTN